MAPLPNKESWAISVVDAWKALSFTDDNGIQIISANAAELKTTLDAIVSYVEASPGRTARRYISERRIDAEGRLLGEAAEKQKRIKKKTRGRECFGEGLHR